MMGVRLYVDGELLRWKAAKGVVTPDLVEDIRRLKPALIDIVNQCGDDPRPARPNRLRWADVPHSNPPRPLDTPTDPARVQLAEEIGAILTTFPKGNCKLFKSGDWMIHGNRYSHDQAVQLVATVTARRNGQEVPPPMVPDFDAGAAYRANIELVTSIAIKDTQSTLVGKLA